jgi:hypothetical protein
MGTKRKSALLKTSSKSDVQRSNGKLTVTGLGSVESNTISGISQINYKAEVVQVVTLGDSSYTPTAATIYKFKVVDVELRREGRETGGTTIAYTTPPVIATLGNTPALQREAIHAALIIKVNELTNVVNATAVTLGSGNGFTFTDAAGYYPASSNGGQGQRKGANTVVAVTDKDGIGWTAADLTLTTEAVYSFGDGVKMSANEPIIAAYSQLLVSGVLDAPVAADGSFAISGQFYDAYLISSLTLVAGHNQTGQMAYNQNEYVVFVDNGKGASVANLAGSKEFEREMHKEVAKLNESELSLVEFFDKPFTYTGALGVVPVITDAAETTFATPYGSIVHTNINEQTITGPALAATGLNLDQDATATDGAEYAPSILAINTQGFVVGKSDYSVTARVVAADFTDVDFVIGVKPRIATEADIDDYANMAAIGGAIADGDSITTRGILAAAVTVNTNTGVNFADGVSILLEILVAEDGTVTAKADGVTYPIYSAGTTALVLPADVEMVPFFRQANLGGGVPATVISEFIAIPNASWKG